MAAGPRGKAADGAPVGQSTSPGLSGWCIADQHAECLYLACTCTACPPRVHHSRMHERRTVAYGQTVTLALQVVDVDGEDVPVGVAEAA